MSGDRERSIAAVLTDIVGNVQQIIQKEIRLAKVEVRQEVGKARRAATLLAVGGAIAALALGFLLLAAVYSLSMFVAPWIAALIVGGSAGGVGAGLIAAGAKQMQEVAMLPPATMAALEENLRWTKAPVK